MSTEADFEADELAEAPTLENGTFDFEQAQQPTRSTEQPLVLTTANNAMRSYSIRFDRAAAGEPRRSRTGYVLILICRVQLTAASKQAELLPSMLLPVVESQLQIGICLRMQVLHTHCIQMTKSSTAYIAKARLFLLVYSSSSARKASTLPVIILSQPEQWQ